MSKEEAVEDRELTLDVVPSKGIVELNQDKFDAIFKYAEQVERIGRALDSIRKFVLTRALSNDWVRHGDNLNLTGPGAERILSNLGLMGVSSSFTSWKYKKDTGTDKNGEWFTWWYEATVQIGGIIVEGVQGRAGSRDKFFGYKDGGWKDLSDVKEADIRMAARRGVIKEGIKLALGLRSIPFESAAALGINVEKVKKVEFGGDGAGGAGTAPAESKTPLLIKHVGQRKFTKKDKTQGTIYVIEDERGTKYETFSDTVAKAATELWKAGKKVLLDWEANGKYAPKLSAVSEADASQPDPEPEPDAQEPA